MVLVDLHGDEPLARRARLRDLEVDPVPVPDLIQSRWCLFASLPMSTNRTSASRIFFVSPALILEISFVWISPDEASLNEKSNCRFAMNKSSSPFPTTSTTPTPSNHFTHVRMVRGTSSDL